MAHTPGALSRAALAGLALAILGGCRTVAIPTPGAALTEAETVDLIRHPRRWYGRTVTLQVYPYDFGPALDRSYLICFEPCDEAGANRSPAILDTLPGRFENYRGDRGAVVTARFQSNCAHLPDPRHRGRLLETCPDFISLRFIESDQPGG